MSQYLTKIRSKPLYFKFKADLERVFRKIPGVGEPTVRVLKKVKDSFRHMLTNNTIFEDLGFTYCLLYTSNIVRDGLCIKAAQSV